MQTLRTLVAYRRYIWASAVNELRYRYAGSGIGVFWNVVNPLVQVLVYAVVLSAIVGGQGPSPFPRGLFLCLGLLPWLAFSESLVRGSQALVRNAGWLRSLPVPPEVYVAEAAVASTLSLWVTLAILAAAATWFGHPPGWRILLLPPLGAALQAMAFGLSLPLAGARVFFPDTGEILRVVLQLWMWTLPIVYPESLLPGRLSTLARLNPAYLCIRPLREACLGRGGVTGTECLLIAGWAALFVVGGSALARRLRAPLLDAV